MSPFLVWNKSVRLHAECSLGTSKWDELIVFFKKLYSYLKKKKKEWRSKSKSSVIHRVEAENMAWFSLDRWLCSWKALGISDKC